MNKLEMKHAPKKLWSDIVYSCSFMTNPIDFRLLVLTKRLSIFEVKNKEILSSFDLQTTIMKDTDLSSFVRNNLLPEDEEMDSGSDMFSSRNSDESLHGSDSKIKDFCFGRYTQYGKIGKTFFLLVKVLNKLVVLKYGDREFEFFDGYEDVRKFEIIDPSHTYEPFVLIHFENGAEALQTNFAKNSAQRQMPVDDDEENENNSERILEPIIQEIDNQRQELEMHKIETYRRCIGIKDSLMFGPNFIRSRMEELQLLCKNGDVWIRVKNEILLIGIPIVNNSSESLTTLQNVRLILLSPHIEQIQYDFNLYKLQNDVVYTFENYEDFLEEDDETAAEKNFGFNEEWSPSKTHTLHPETAGVMIARMNIKSLSNLQDCKLLFFVLCDVKTANEEVITLQNFIKEIKFQPAMLYENKFQLKFDPESAYKDFLSIVATSEFAYLSLNYNTRKSPTALSEFLINTMGFTCVRRNEVIVDDKKMKQFDGTFEPSQDFIMAEVQNSVNYVFYHKGNVNSYWDGTLIRLASDNINPIDFLKIYTGSEEKILTFVQILYKEFEEDCTILPTSTKKPEKFRHFQQCLTKELDMIGNFCQNSKDKRIKLSETAKFQEELFRQEFETDLQFLSIF